MTEPRIVTIVQARMGSQRLPGKSLLALAGRPMLVHVLTRAQAMGYPVWLATSGSDRDNPLIDLGISLDIPTFAGHERDVLGRMREAADASAAEVVVRVTGDCPLLAPDVGRAVVALYLARCAGTQDVFWRNGIATNDTAKSGWPDGLDVEVFSADLLRRADEKTGDTWADREHVTPWMLRTGTRAVLDGPREKVDRKLKLSVDTMEDFDFVRSVMGALDGNGLDWPATAAALGRLRS